MKAGSRLNDGRRLDGVSFPAGAVIRTCIGCRQKAAVTDLLRVVVKPVAPPVDAGSDPPMREVLPDPRRRAAGRGAWLHPVPECVELAERRRAFARALRSSSRLDPAAVRQYVESLAG
ncbi:MAG: YlxR family protein [Actinomycetota bacterium]|nr:YlxR family protein [Actinomycetota bacterium]